MRAFFCLCVCLFVGTVNAAVIDTTASWANGGWFGSGQSFTVDVNDTFFDDVTFSFDDASNGLTFDFLLSDALNAGSTLFSTSFSVNNGSGFIDIDTNLIAGSTVYALIDYNGYSGASAYFQYDVYAGGNSIFGANGSNFGFSGFDHVFVANFTQATQAIQASQVPEPVSIVLLGLGFMAIFLSRKSKAD